MWLRDRRRRWGTTKANPKAGVGNRYRPKTISGKEKLKMTLGSINKSFDADKTNSTTIVQWKLTASSINRVTTIKTFSVQRDKSKSSRQFPLSVRRGHAKTDRTLHCDHRNWLVGPANRRANIQGHKAHDHIGLWAPGCTCTSVQ